MILTVWSWVISMPLLAQVDTSNLRFTERLTYGEGENLKVLALEANKMGIVDETGNWLIPPYFGAIAGYDAERNIVSARDSSFEHTVDDMRYWDDMPLLTGWGVANQKGEWLVSPNYQYPFDLESPWQIKNSSMLESHLYVGLTHKWPGEYQEISHLDGDLFILNSMHGHLGVRNLQTNEWVIPYGLYFHIPGETALFVSFPFEESRTYFRLTTLNAKGEKAVYHGFPNVLSVFQSEGLCANPSAESGEMGSDQNPGYFVNKDSVFGKWYLHSFWLQLYRSGNDDESYDSYADMDYFQNTIADSIYAKLPEYWHPFYRVEEHSYHYSIWPSGRNGYSLLESDDMLSHGSRGGAVEREKHHWYTVQRVDDQMMHLSLSDCFQEGDTSILRSVLMERFADTATFYLERWDTGRFQWQLHGDSLLLHFPVREHVLPYYHWRIHYRTVAIPVKELGKAFVNERKRAKSLRKRDDVHQ